MSSEVGSEIRRAALGLLYVRSRRGRCDDDARGSACRMRCGDRVIASRLPEIGEFAVESQTLRAVQCATVAVTERTGA